MKMIKQMILKKPCKKGCRWWHLVSDSNNKKENYRRQRLCIKHICKDCRDKK